MITRHELFRDLHKCGPVTTIVRGEPYGQDRDQTVVWCGELRAVNEDFILGECIVNARRTHAYVYWKDVLKIEVQPDNTYYTPALAKALQMGWRVIQGGRTVGG